MMISPRFALKAIALAVVAQCAAIPSFAADTSCTNCFQKRWIYFAGNFTANSAASDPTYQKLIEVIDAAKTLGYNGIALNAGGSGSFTAMLNSSLPSNYKANFAGIVQHAKDQGIELIPVGGGMDVPVTAAPDLIEALPTIDTPFVAHGGIALPVSDSKLTDTSFESGDSAWALFDVDSTSITYDTTVAHTGTRSVKYTQANPKGAARLYRQLTNLRPHAAYRLSFWMKSQDYDGPLRVMITDPTAKAPMYQNASAPLGWSSVGAGWASDGNKLQATQEWKQYSLDLNTGNNSVLNLYIGAWSNSATKSGAAWLDDIELKEIGLAHTIRRTPQSLPITVRSEDGSITYVEGRDYAVGVESLTLPSTTTIKEDSKLRVSFYQSAQNMISMWGTPASACYQKYFDIQKKNYDNINALLGTPSKYFIYYDENRIFNWDPNCPADTAGTAGNYLAKTFQKYQDTLSAAYPNLELYVWHDMFDPNANAVQQYWAVNGDLTNSWTGLRPTTTIVNWTDSINGKPIDSLKFFNGLAQKQIIAGYYDDSSAELKELKAWMDALNTAEQQGVSGVNGFMYTTFKGNSGYADLQRVTEYLKTNYPNRWPQ